MPRLSGLNTSAHNYTLRAQGVNEAQHYSIPPATDSSTPGTFSFDVSDLEFSQLVTQAQACSGVTLEQRDVVGRAELLPISASAPAAASVTSVHASIAGNNATKVFTSGITNPDVPRNVTATFAGSYDGGDIQIDGTDQFDKPISETLLANAGSSRTGVKVFKTVTTITRSTVGINAAGVSIGCGDKLGLPKRILSVAQAVLFISLAVDANPTWDATYHAVLPGSTANASRTYLALANV